MAHRTPTLLAAAMLAWLSMARPAPAANPRAPSSRADLRERIETIAGTVESFRWSRAPGSGIPGLTAQAQALLAAPHEDLAAALKQAAEAAESADGPGRGGASIPRRLAAFLLGRAQTANCRYDGEYFVEVQGFCLAASVSEPFGYNQHTVLPPVPKVDLENPGPFRRPLRPRPFDLLKEVLADSPRIRELASRWVTGTFCSSAAMELGDAARRDPGFGKFLLAVASEDLTRPPSGPKTVRTANGMSFIPGSRGKREETAASVIVRGALDRWAGAGSADELLPALREAKERMEFASWDELLGKCVEAMNGTGAAAALAFLRGEEPPAATERGDSPPLSPGDRRIRDMLASMGDAPAVGDLRRLARLLNSEESGEPSVETRLLAFDRAMAVHRAAESSARSEAAWAALQCALWPAMYSSYGYLGPVLPPQDFAGGVRDDGNPRECFLGGYPDPARQAAALRDLLARGTVRRDTRFVGYGASTYFRTVEIWRDRDPEVDPKVELKARRDGASVVLTVTNRRAEPLAVNPLVQDFAIAAVYPLKGEAAGRVELRLGAGRFLEGYRFRIDSSTYRILAPGESTTLTFPLRKNLPASARIVLDFDDRFTLAAPFEVTVLSRIFGLKVE